MFLRNVIPTRRHIPEERNPSYRRKNPESHVLATLTLQDIRTQQAIRDVTVQSEHTHIDRPDGP